MFNKVLIANRGAIACRILRTLKQLGIGSVAVYSEADRHALHVRHADEAVCIGTAPAADSYLRQERILAAAHASGAGAIHPGYGFLSENAEFAAACEANQIAFIGPTPQQMRDFGLKHTARALAAVNGLPMLPGSGLLTDLDHALEAADQIGYPVMLKSTAGGGGIGMQQCNDEAQLRQAFDSVRRLAQNNFSQAGVFVEKFVSRARHIEVQIFGDGLGTVVALGERDCSAQRRNQKVIEETPAPGLGADTRQQLAVAATRLAAAVKYRSAGTVEFVFDADTSRFYFLEVNTRLQVEHGVTEAVTGIDLVAWMIQLAAGSGPDLASYRHSPHGHAIQARIYAEDPARNFRPASGLLSEVRLPGGLRVDSWIETGSEVPANYDPMLAKLIAHADTREAAIAELDQALKATEIHGIETNVDYLRAVLATPEFRRGTQTTRLLGTMAYHSATVEVLQAGTHSLIQEWPGRLGLWDVGVPPSGPMDALAFRLANRIVGNEEGTAALELTVSGPTLRFASDAVVALAGAPMHATLDGAPVPYWLPLAVRAGSVLRVGAIEDCGQRAYLAFQGGLNVPTYMGSRATFALGLFGGHAGRALRSGDVLRLNNSDPRMDRVETLTPDLIPKYGHHWSIDVREGPHAAPDFFTPQDIETFYATDWEVHYNSSRTGVRLIGPKPVWARRDGGEAGLHPSNIHDNAYAIGSIDYTGDMPVILGPDGPSLGGFVCPATITRAELWKSGQLRPGDHVRFRRVANQSAVLHRAAAQGNLPAVVVRQAGDDNILVEFGAPELDLALRFSVQALYEKLLEQRIGEVVDLTPGIRSLQVHFDSMRITQSGMLERILHTIGNLPAIDQMELPSRIVYLPLSWDDPATRLAIERYQQSVRADAPWCPSNIEFIQRINGLESVDDVRRIVFDASYLVMGLGDVYLGAPVATPLDPRHRLVTTKYNPARTWTPENAVGIGGSYLCVYGMEGPGGYQFVGRTLQMWNRHRQSADFRDGKRWLLRFFDQIRFYPVSAQELMKLRAGFTYGQYPLRIESATLKLGQYRQFLADNAASIDTFRARQRTAFEAERERWRAAGEVETPIQEATANPVTGIEVPMGHSVINAPVSGSVWQLKVAVGDRVVADQELLVLESMKMEISVRADAAGIVSALHCAANRAVSAGAALVMIKDDAP
jgi:urea carboxylase